MHLSVVHWCLPHEYNLIRGTGAGSLPQSSHLAQTRSPWSITLADLIKTLEAVVAGTAVAGNTGAMGYILGGLEAAAGAAFLIFGD